MSTVVFLALRVMAILSVRAAGAVGLWTFGKVCRLRLLGCRVKGFTV